MIAAWFLLVVTAAIALTGEAQKTGTAKTVPVLVELFTAEGCSSCPPADVLLAKLLETQPTAGATLVGLGNTSTTGIKRVGRIGVRSAMFTKRQQQYATRSRKDDVHTPEMVVDVGDHRHGCQCVRHKQDRSLSRRFLLKIPIMQEG